VNAARLRSCKHSAKHSLEINQHEIKPRRKKVNKYSSLTTEKVDPIERVLNRVKEDENMAQQDFVEKTVLTGTTVPTVHGSNDARTTTSHQGKSLIEKNNYNHTHSQHIKLINFNSINPSDPSTFGFIEIGRVLGAHGINGQVKIVLETDFAEQRLKANSVMFIKKPNRYSPRPIKICSSKRQVDDMFIVQFHGIKSRITATALRDYTIFIKDLDRPPLATDEYLIRDIVGLKCFHQNHQETPVGTVVGVIPPCELYDKPIADIMHPLLEIRKYRSKELVLVPYVSNIVVGLDLPEKKIFLNPPAGLLDLSYVHTERVFIKGYLPEKVTWMSEDQRKILQRNNNLKFCEGGMIIEED
jgi:16S rRNA processing protein RimM